MRKGWIAAGLAAAAALAAASGGQELRGARVGATDVPALAAFYETVFGLKEVNKFNAPGIEEIILNFGADVEAAKANAAPSIVVMNRAPDFAPAGDVPRLILEVEDLDATVAAVTANGGGIDREPFAFQGGRLAFVHD